MGGLPGVEERIRQGSPNRIRFSLPVSSPPQILNPIAVSVLPLPAIYQKVIQRHASLHLCRVFGNLRLRVLGLKPGWKDVVCFLFVC